MSATLSSRQVSHATGIGMPRLTLWRQRGLVSRPYNTTKTLSLAIGCYFADCGMPFEMTRKAVSLVASKTEDELLAHFARGETRLTLDTGSLECAIEAASALARRAAAEDARIFSIPLKTAYERVVLNLRDPAA